METTNPTTTVTPTVTPPLSLVEQLEDRERAIASLEFLPSTDHYTIRCNRTGVPIASIAMIVHAGKLPYLSNWKDSVAYHPLFSLEPLKLLSFTRNNWNKLFAGSSDHVTDREKQTFCIAFVAILHSLDSIKQSTTVLPSFLTVTNNMQRLLELAYWYHYLQSTRFRFPTYNISKLNANEQLSNVNHYLEICEAVKEEYEERRNTATEEVRIEAARRAEKAVRGAHARPISKKILWNWFLSSLAAHNPKRYELPEWKEWVEDSAKLWFASNNQQLQYSTDDVDTIEEVFLQTCALGSIISNAFKNELGKIRDRIDSHNKTFTIDWLSTFKANNGATVVRTGPDGIERPIIVTPTDPGPAPLIGNYSSRTEYIRAEAKWSVAVMQWNAYREQQRQIEAVENTTATVDEPTTDDTTLTDNTTDTGEDDDTEQAGDSDSSSGNAEDVDSSSGGDDDYGILTAINRSTANRNGGDHE